VQRRARLDQGDWENAGEPTTQLTATVVLPGDMGFFQIVQP